MGEMVEEGLNSSMIMSYSAIKATTQAIQSGTGGLLGKKKKEDVAMVISGSWHGQRGHDIEKCWRLKMAIQELIDTNQIVVQGPDAPNINQNPLPAHAEMHMIEIVHKDGEPKKSSKSVIMIRASKSNLVKTSDSTKAKPLIVEGVTEKPSSKPPVLVVKGLSKDIGASPGSSKVAVPGILMVDAKAVPWNYEQVIVTYKGKEIEEEVNETGGLARSGRCFTPEELRKAKPFKDSPMPVKKSITEEEAEEFLKKMKVQDYSIVEQVLVDNGSSANICPLSTLQKLKIDTETIHLKSVCVRGSDGGGRTWIHVAKSVPFSLHQMVKFEWDKQEIVVHSDEDLSTCNDTIVPFIEAEDNKGPWNGFVPSKGLGSSLQGIVHPVRLSGNPGTFGLGFMPTEKDMKRVKNLKQKVWSLPKPVPHISKSFVKPGTEKPPTSSIPKPVVDVDEELIRRFQSLFEEVNMVEVGEGSSKANVHLVGLNVKLSNWESTPFPTRKEFCSFYAGCSDMACMKSFPPSLKSQSNSEITIQEVEYDDEIVYDEEAAFEDISKELKQFEEKPKPNLTFPPVKQKLRKFKTDMSVKIKEEITKQLTTKVIQVTQYPTWLANVAPAPKKDGKTRVCVDYRDLNKASPKDDFPLPNIHILIDNCAKHEIGFIAQLTTTCESIFKLLKKNVVVKWTDECQEAFDKIKRYLSNPPVLVPPDPGRPLILYLTVLDNSFGCVLGQYDITGKKE
ncbi:uncharacterized protein [Nicotiana sylvestris]|uniref:uncharacterized protein n=1 Tax=Nicotiana sylvestris TaxID=4096 RepID=UPI00388C5B11